MQIDFHHTAIYVLCRLAGMDSCYAEIVAYASQQVDDATYGHALKFMNGGIFHQTRTAHAKLSLFKMVDVNDAFNVWIPFHFIPSSEGDSIMEKLITRPVSRPIELLKEEVINAGGEDYGLYWLGIFLHLYADAFSHQDFKGFYDSYNLVKLVKGHDRLTLKTCILSWLAKIFSPLLPIGHAVAAKNPDIPYAVFSYSRGGETYEIKNLEERFLPAVKLLFEFMINYLKVNPEYGRAADTSLLDRQFDKIKELLSTEGDYHFRHQKWLESIHQNHFDFCDFNDIDRMLTYQRRSWFDKAVKANSPCSLLQWIENKTYNFHMFKKLENFSVSDWTLFMRAAAIHKYILLHKILPECGMDIG
ncbi:MAG: DUF6765 family protein [Halanaerobiales bacterium]